MADKKDVKQRSHNKIEKCSSGASPHTSDIPVIPSYTMIYQINQQREILQELESTFKKKLIDRWLLWDREKLIRKNPDYTLEYINKILPDNLTRGKGYYGTDLKRMISVMDDPIMVKPTDITKYISIGVSNINHYFKKKGKFHFLICNKGTSMQGLEDIGFHSNMPILVINGIYTHAIAYLPSDISYETVIGFKKVANNPFRDLVKFIAKQIPDDFTPWIRSWRRDIDADHIDGRTSDANGRKSTSKNDNNSKRDKSKSERDLPSSSRLKRHRVKVGNEDTNSQPLSKKVQRNDNCDKKESCPGLSVSDQETVLQKLQCLVVKDTQQRVSCKQAKLVRKSPKLSPRNIKENLYMLLLHKEKYAGMDIIQLILNLSDECDPTTKQKSNYISTGVDAICKFIQDGGAYILLLVCSSAADSISKNEDFQSSINDTPVCIINNLSGVTNTFVRLKEEGKVIGFKKVENNIFSELVEFVADRMPKGADSLVSWWKNEIPEKSLTEDDIEGSFTKFVYWY